MSPALLLELRPAGPWRVGPASGSAARVDRLLRSDAVYSAVSHAMAALGWSEEWFAATAAAGGAPAASLSSLFPSQEENLLAPPPAHLWPPAAGIARLHASGARMIPVTLIRALALGEEWNEDQWEVDGLSECLLRRGRRRPAGSPYRVATRVRAAVDRIDAGRIALHESACLEFAPGAGLWCVAAFSGEESRDLWAPRIESCFRLLADSGMGGERHSGWGHFSVERAARGDLPDLIWGRRRPTGPVPEFEGTPAAAEERGWWLLSLFSPAGSDQVDWSRGSYRLLERSGRVDSPAGRGALKKRSRMVEEGSVLIAPGGLTGRAWDVAPDGFPHPVWRSGHAVAIELPWRIPA